jgi:hypothetical protein
MQPEPVQPQPRGPLSGSLIGVRRTLRMYHRVSRSESRVRANSRGLLVEAIPPTTREETGPTSGHRSISSTAKVGAQARKSRQFTWY